MHPALTAGSAQRPRHVEDEPSTPHFISGGNSPAPWTSSASHAVSPIDANHPFACQTELDKVEGTLVKEVVRENATSVAVIEKFELTHGRMDSLRCLRPSGIR